MKTTLNQMFVLTKLSIDKKPVLMAGKIVFEDNPSGAPYIVFDDHRDSPVGFGVKVAVTKKTYVIQRKVQGKVIKSKIGNVSDFATIDKAREKARSMAGEIQHTKRNPNVAAREKSANELTLGGCFEKYRNHLTKRSQPAKPNTFKVFDKAVTKLSGWAHIRVQDLSTSMILDKFDEIAKLTPTTAEQTFRWANAAVAKSIQLESIDANNSQRTSSLIFNPFVILHTESRYRTRNQLNRDYEKKGIKKPLSNETLPKFLDAVWKKRKENRTGCDYLLLTLLWGTRKNESYPLVWRDVLTDVEAKITSHVCLEAGIVFFYDTKNHSNLILPLGDFAIEILKQRNENRENFSPSKQKWVFPARSKFSKTGHYSDTQSLMKYVCQEAGIARISNHDLRRTYASMADEVISSAMLKRLINHRKESDITESYIHREFDRVKESLQRMENYLISKSPTIYNALLPTSRQPI